jgi:hypothetical protein
MRVDENWERMGCLYCSTGGTIYRGEDPPRASGQGERRLGEAAALGAAPPLTLTLMGCGSPLGLGRRRLGGGSSRRLGLRLPKP